MFTGLVEEIGVISDIKDFGDGKKYRISSKKVLEDIDLKESISVSGICLTVVKVGASSFSLSVIPYTLTKTNLQNQAKGGRVNLEVDIVAKYVESLLAR